MIHDIHCGLPWLLAGLVEAGTVPAIEVRGLCYDSRRVQPGDLFVALAGWHVHALSHAAQAIRRGCVAIVFEPSGGGMSLARDIVEVPCVPVPSLAQKIGFIADRFFGEPSRHIPTVIGITGTNGKTSCSHFLAEALAGPAPGAVLGTLGWGTPGELRPVSLYTTPEAIEVQDILSRMHREGYGAVALEASSHGLEQGRLNGVRFRGALYTNFSRDHLDYHGSMEAYLDAKLRLLAWPGLEFVAFNAADPSAAAILERRPVSVRGLGFSVTGQTTTATEPLVTVSAIRQGAEGIVFQAHYQGQTAEVRAPVFGDFNVENLTAALTVLLGLGHDLAEAADLLKKVRAVPGRMESFTGAGRTVVVDYAHTPDALACVLTSLRQHCAGQLWVVFGCGGDRDRGKRPEMGAIAERLADRVVLTDDNPRSESSEEIIRDILAGCRRDDIVRIGKRRDAIVWALERAGSDDLVLLAGKGHETTQEIQGQQYPFSDHEVVRETLARLGARS